MTLGAQVQMQVDIKTRIVVKDASAEKKINALQRIAIIEMEKWIQIIGDYIET